MEDASYQIIKKNIPSEWVIREFNRPDYGIDLVIELFEKTSNENAETLGEFIYVQVKSVLEVVLKEEKIYPVGNVAKGEWREDKSEFIPIDVAKYVIDTNSIYTIHSLGGSVSVLLFLVDIKTENTYFICLNDYIDKILLPQNSAYSNQESVTLTIPALNNLRNRDIADNALRFYGKRGKLLAAFSKFAYQKNELAHALGYKFYPIWTYRDELEKDRTVTIEEIKSLILYFINQIEDLDIWRHSGWDVLQLAKSDLMKIKVLIKDEKSDWEEVKNKIIVLWHQMTNLGTMYEDICRESFLPKVISLQTSYPTIPKLVKSK